MVQPPSPSLPAVGRVLEMRFDGLEICYDQTVLEPRKWTAEQSRWGAELSPGLPAGPVLELCSGAGHIGLLTAALSGRRLVAVDLDPSACAFTRLNAARAGLPVEVREGPMDRVLRPAERFALVTADPPWVPRAETGRFPADPVLAIDGGDDGLEVARLCVTVAESHLAEGGVLLLQLGSADQVERVDAWAEGRTGLRVVEARGHGDRGVVARLDRVAPGR
jgi:methylase of polypeptide subunit release factors